MWDYLDADLLETPNDIRHALWSMKFQRNKDGITEEELLAMAVQVEDVDGSMRTIYPPKDGATDFYIEQPESISHIYISVEKNTNKWRDAKTVRANFELYSKEYINLTFMNSVWLEYFISSQKLGGWSIGSKEVIYAHGIRYLKTALDYIRKREEKEKALIDAIDPQVCKDHNWPLELTEWKMETGVHKMTEYQAKRFVKTLKKRKGY